MKCFAGNSTADFSLSVEVVIFGKKLSLHLFSVVLAPDGEATFPANVVRRIAENRGKDPEDVLAKVLSPLVAWIQGTSRKRAERQVRFYTKHPCYPASSVFWEAKARV